MSHPDLTCPVCAGRLHVIHTADDEGIDCTRCGLEWSMDGTAYDRLQPRPAPERRPVRL